MRKIIIADDHQILLDGLSGLIEKIPHLSIIATAKNGRELVEKAILLKPDLILTDIEMPEMSGIEAIKKLNKSIPQLKTIVLSMHNDAVIEKILNNLNVDGILYKNANEETIIEAVTKISNGEKYKPATEKHILAPLITGNTGLGDENLTTREIEIIKFVAEGYSNKEIAEQINISHRTVDKHRTNLMKKLNLHSAVDITRYAFKNKLL